MWLRDRTRCWSSATCVTSSAGTDCPTGSGNARWMTSSPMCSTPGSVWWWNSTVGSTSFRGSGGGTSTGTTARRCAPRPRCATAGSTSPTAPAKPPYRYFRSSAARTRTSSPTRAPRPAPSRIFGTFPPASARYVPEGWLAVPVEDGGGASFPAEDGDGGGVEDEVAAFGDVQFKPAGGEGPQRVRVAEDEDVARDGGDARADSVQAGRHLRGRFTAGYRIVPDRPARDGLADLRGRDAFVVAVVPLDEVVVDLGVGVAGEFGRTTGALPGRREDQIERLSRQPRPQTRRHALALGCQREVGDGRV